MTKKKGKDDQKPAEDSKKVDDRSKTSILEDLNGKMATALGGLNDLLGTIPADFDDGMDKRIGNIKKSVVRIRNAVVSRMDRVGKKTASTEKKRELLARIEKRAAKIKAELAAK